MSTVVLVAADSSEISGLNREIGLPALLDWPVAHAVAYDHRGWRLIGVADGAGPELAGRAARIALDSETAGAVVSTGFCGGLDPALKAGDIFVATSVRSGEDEYAVRAVRNRSASRQGILLSVDRIVGTAEEKKRLWTAGCMAVEMESAAVAAEAARRGIPFYCVRVVTDTADESFVCDLNAARLPDGRISRWLVVQGALRRPARGIAELFRLWRRSAEGAARLAAFLTECEFEHE